MTTVITAITAVFTAIGQWLVTAITAMEAVFWAEGALTFVGTLAVVGLAIAVILDIIGHYISDNINETTLTAGNSYLYKTISNQA